MKKTTFNIFSKKKFYIKMFSLYTLFTFLIIILSSIILFTYFNKHLKNEIQEANYRLLEQIQSFSDNYSIQQVNSIATDKFLNVNRDSIISNFYLENYHKNNVSLYKAYNYLQKLVATNDIVDSIELYRTFDDTVISTNKGILFSIKKKSESFNHSNIVNYALSEPENKFWVSPKDNDIVNKPTLSFCHSIPLFAQIGQREGCMIINISAEAYYQQLSQFFTYENGQLMIISNEGDLMIHNESDALYRPLAIDDVALTEILSLDSGYKYFSTDNQIFNISWIKSQSTDWKYITIIPHKTLYRQLFLSKQFTIIVIVNILILSIFGIYILSRVLYKPVGKAVASVQEHFPYDGNLTEFELIKFIVSNISSRLEEMKDTLHNNKGVIQYKIASDIIYGLINTPESVNERLKVIQSSFLYNRYVILLIDFNPNVLGELPLNQQEFIMLKVSEIIEQYFKVIPAICLSICHPSNQLVTVINTDEDLMPYFDELLNLLQGEFGIELNIAISDNVDSIKEVHKLYTKTLTYLKYSFIHGYNNIFDYTTIEKYENDYFNDNIDFTNYENLLKCNKIQEIKENLTTDIQAIKDSSCSYQTAQNIFIHMVKIISTVSKDKSLDFSADDKSYIFSSFSSVNTLDEGLDWLLGIVDIYAKYTLQINSILNSELINNICNFITDNIDEQISLKMVANHFNTSSSYLSRIFKEGTQSRFSEYVTNKKFERAAELLENEPKMKVGDIAQRVGYYNLSYFNKLFKQRYGLTPLQYRKRHKCIHL